MMTVVMTATTRNNRLPVAFTSPVATSNFIDSRTLPTLSSASSSSSSSSYVTSRRHHVKRTAVTTSTRAQLPSMSLSDSERFINGDDTLSRSDPLLPEDPLTTTDQVNDVIEDDDHTVVRDTDLLERQRRQATLSNTASPNIPVPPPPTIVEIAVSDTRTMRFETGRMARQAAGAVAVWMGDTMVFCTSCSDPACGPSVDFLPLRVDYSEKFSSSGRTSGSYVKREGRPSEREVLISRLIDRPLRPMFEDGYYNEVQVSATVFSFDGIFPGDALAICGASAALHISHIPLAEPVAGVRLAYIKESEDKDGKFVVEPTTKEMEGGKAKAELVIAGSRRGILMIEGFCDFLTTEQIIEGVKVAHESIIRICDGIDELRRKTGNTEKIATQLRKVPKQLEEKLAEITERLQLDAALAVIGKKDRDVRVTQVRDEVFSAVENENVLDSFDNGSHEIKKTLLKLAWKELVSERMRRRIIDTGIRPDGRDVYTVRPITIDLNPLPKVHGSALFTRGETQTLAVATLGGDDMAQRFETLEGEDASRFYLQYSFPPSSVGEVGRLGPPGRREVGHGKLAERALMAAIPDKSDFPYVLRVESNILESNGSSSMASVCGGCLALLDAGVPMKCSVAGVAMGLVVDKSKKRRRPVDIDINTDVDVDSDNNNDDDAVILTDILGLEDALGSCDAKFAGNRNGWSALQLDVKLRGISIALLGRILHQASNGLYQVLDNMDAQMPLPNPKLPSSLPKVVVVNIPPNRIGELIGPGGKSIRGIIDKCGGEEVTRISVDNDGRVSISCSDDEMIALAKEIVAGFSTNIKVGMIVDGRIKKLLPFGAFVEISEGTEGWMHISEMDTKRTGKVEDLFKIGDKVVVKLTETGRNGQFRLSRKAVLEATANEKVKSSPPISSPPASPSTSSSSISSTASSSTSDESIG